MMNNRTMATGGGAAPVADFGNCNSLILRCAQPKCAGCTTVDVARPIVAGCVNSNATCKKYGDDLIEFISAQMVSTANAKAQQQMVAAQQQAAAQQAAQSNAQLAQMQQQMQQMQYEMQQQNAQQMAQMQAALEEQKQIAAAAQAAAVQQATVSTATTADNVADGLTAQQTAAARAGVDEEIMLRQQVSGQILTKIENAEVLLKALKANMDATFAYAGCDKRGNNCTGPKRVKTFKDKANQFFEPYDDIVNETYDALETALAVGVDVSDVIMMLSGSCNKWGRYLCTGIDSKHVIATYTHDSCKGGRSVKGAPINVRGSGEETSVVKVGNLECTPGMAVPPQDDVRCTMVGFIDESVNNGEGVYREWIDENYEGDRLVRVGCATDMLSSISILGRRASRTGATLDLDTLERILAQDAPDYVNPNRYMAGYSTGDPRLDKTKYCALTDDGYQTLLRAVQTHKLPSKICVSEKELIKKIKSGGMMADLSSWGGTGGMTGAYVPAARDKSQCDYWNSEAVQAANGCGATWNETDSRCVVTGDSQCRFVQGCDDYGRACIKKVKGTNNSTTGAGSVWSLDAENCTSTGGRWTSDAYGFGYCTCPGDKIADSSQRCVVKTVGAVDWAQINKNIMDEEDEWNKQFDAQWNTIVQKSNGGLTSGNKVSVAAGNNLAANCERDGGQWIDGDCECPVGLTWSARNGVCYDNSEDVKECRDAGGYYIETDSIFLTCECAGKEFSPRQCRCVNGNKLVCD